MRRLLTVAAALAFCAWSVPAAVYAQQTVQAETVAACGTPNNTPVAGRAYNITINASGALCISGTISATNPAVGTNGAVAPTSSILNGWLDGGGLLQPVAAATPLPVGGSGAAGTAATGVLTTQGIAGMVPIQIAGATLTAPVGSSNALTVTPVTTAGGAVAWLFAATNSDTLATTGSVNALVVNAVSRVWNGTNYSRTYQVANATDSTGTGITAAGLLAQCDDTSTTATSENQFGNVRKDCAGAQLLMEPYAPGSQSWSFAGASGGIVSSTTGVTMVGAAGAGVRNYVYSCQLATDTLGAATEVAIRDGAAGTVLWRGKLQTTALPQQTIVFEKPLRGTAATLTEVAVLTSVTGGVYVNCQGFQAP